MYKVNQRSRQKKILLNLTIVVEKGMRVDTEKETARPGRLGGELLVNDRLGQGKEQTRRRLGAQATGADRIDQARERRVATAQVSECDRRVEADARFKRSGLLRRHGAPF